jgi:hypothetical protein
MVLRGLRVEATTSALARLAGEALAAVPATTVVDAIALERNPVIGLELQVRGGEPRHGIR